MADTLSIEARSQLQGVIKQLNDLAAGLGNAGAQGNKASGGLSNAGSGADRLASGIGTLQAAIAALGLGKFAKDSLELFIQQEQAVNILAGATGNLSTAREELERWRHVTEALGLEFNKSSVLYARLLVTAQQADIPLENARAAADGLAIAQRAMNLSSYDAELAFRALGQIANKTVVNMEELRQQLGERVAGVMKALSDRMGITTKELFKMAETGELSAKVFFEKFGPAMAEAFKEQSINNADSLAANIERIGNAARRVQVEFAKGFGGELNRSIQESATATKGAEAGFRSLGEGLGVVVGWITNLLSGFHKIRAVFAEVQGWTLDAAASFVEFTEDSLQALGDLYAFIAKGTKSVGLDDLSKRAEGFATAAFEGGKKAQEFASDLRDLAETSKTVAKEQLDAQTAMDKSGRAASDAAKDINALAAGADTVGDSFNKMDPAINQFTDRINALGEKTKVAVEAITRLMDKQGGVLNPSQLAAARDEIEKLVRAFDFKNIPPELAAVAKALGVSTEATKKNTEAAKQASAAQREFLQEINKVTDALQRQSEQSKEAAEDNAKRVKELEGKNTTGIDPEELNLLDELKGKQASLNEQAKKDAEAATEAQTLLNEANLAAGQTAEVAASQYDKAATSLLGVGAASQNAKDRLIELQAAFASSGGAAAQFGVPGGSPGSPSPPGVGPFAPGFTAPGTGGTPFPFGGLQGDNAGGFGQPGVDFTNQPIDLFNALDTGLAGTNPDVIAKMLVDQWLGPIEQSVVEQASSNPVRITTKDTSPGEPNKKSKSLLGDRTNVNSGDFMGPARETQTLITNVEEAADQAGEVLVDSFDDGSKSMFNLGIAAKDTSKKVEQVGTGAAAAGQQIETGLTAPLEGAAAAAETIPAGVVAAGDALVEAAGAGVGYTDAIVRADGATGDLGFTAEATASSIADAAGAVVDLSTNVEAQAQKAIASTEEMTRKSKTWTEELHTAEVILVRINKLMSGEAVDLGPEPGI